MRIHRLEIEAFGPFPGLEAIDFDQLSAHGLFLLNGPTGAGKTSVLDAICFALYGSVPGVRQDGKRLRSDHATPGAEPRVLCEFSARGRRFEVTRSPAWDRPSARGSNGFTTQKAKTLLRERIDGQWVEKSGRNDEAGAEITALLGMDREQFTRVVMLPQGDFAAFLRAKATDRLELLQKLFGTQRFEAIEQQLVREAADAKADVADNEARLQRLVDQAGAEFAALNLGEGGANLREDAADRRPPAADPAGADADAGQVPAEAGAEALLRWFNDISLAEASRRRVAAESAAAEQQRLADLVQAEQEKSHRHLRLAAANQRQAQVAGKQDAIAGFRIRLDHHRKAMVLGGQLAAVDSAAQRKFSAARRLDAAIASLGSASIDAGNPAASLAELKETCAVLEARIPDERTLGDLEARIATIAAEERKRKNSREQSGTALSRLRLEAEELARQREPLEQLAGGLPEAQRIAEAAGTLVDNVARYSKAATVEANAAKRHSEGRERLQALRQAWLDLREERLANAAADIAALLEDGKPCPVCGSEDHPTPAATASTALAVAHKEENAHAAFESCGEEVERLALELSEAQRAVAMLAGQGGAADAAEADAAALRAREALTAARAAVDQLASNGAEEERLAEHIAAILEDIDVIDGEAIRAVSLMAALKEQRDAMEAQLFTLRDGHASLRLRIKALDAAKKLFQEAVTAAEQLDRASDSLVEAEGALEAALPSAGFESREDARAVILDQAAAAALESDINAHDAEAAKVEELFSAEDLVLAAKELRIGELPLGGPELERLGRELAEREEATRRHFVAAGLADKAAARLSDIRSSHMAAADEGRRPREKAAMLMRLADTARGSGDNTYRMSLNSYVLAARLEQVALAASERLMTMSDGRYTLQHSDARAARNAKSGLGLEVLDGWTGLRRDTSTLSGGESFMASLSLALGLADVVQQEAGGVDIETLFVDEGFGSLDEQALEQVMDALEGLRDGGRVVGLVSHVAEMKLRIGSQLQVIKGRNGSSVRISSASIAAFG